MPFVSTVIAFFSMVTLGAPPAPPPDGQPPVPALVSDMPVSKPASEPPSKNVELRDDMARYAAMEAKNGKVDDFRGGAVAVYLSTGAAIVVVVILLIVLL